MRFQVRFTAAAVLWTTAFGLALARTIFNVDGFSAWTALTAAFALLPSGWLVVDQVVQRCADEMMDKIEASDEETVERVADKLADALTASGATPFKRR